MDHLTNSRIKDPINYKEACFYIQFSRLGKSTRDHYLSLSELDRITWLGSFCGQSFLRSVDSLIEEYPYKEKSASVIVWGEVFDSQTYEKHLQWIQKKLNQ